MSEQREILLQLLRDGWTSAHEPPNDTRIVQVAWDDGSTGDAALCFYDAKSTIPEDDNRYWWSYPGIEILPLDNVLAWREKPNPMDELIVCSIR
jgi:hypothetical protein